MAAVVPPESSGGKLRYYVIRPYTSKLTDELPNLELSAKEMVLLHPDIAERRLMETASAKVSYFSGFNLLF
jgi:hypothetical protein